jgi:hypothetical protein
LEPHAVRSAELHDLLDHVALLVDLDRVDGGVAAVVLELADRVLEPVAERLDARPQHVGEAEQHRQVHALLLQVVRQVVEVQLPVGMRLVGAHDHVAGLVDVEEAGAPALDVVERARVRDRPGGLRLGGRGGRRGGAGAGHAAYLRRW